MKKKLSVLILLMSIVSVSYCQQLNDIKKHYLNKTVYFRPGEEYKGVKIIMGVTKTIQLDNTVYPHYTSSNADSIAFKYLFPFSYSDSLTNKKYLCIDVKEGDPGNYYIELKDASKFDLNSVIYYKLSYLGGAIYTDEDVAKQESEKADELKEEMGKQKAIDNPCSQVDYFYDEFHYTKKYSTAIQLPDKIADTSYYKNFDAVFYKDIVKGQPTYYLSLSAITSAPDITQKGVIIILKNGKRINKPLARVKTSVETVHDESVYVVSSFIQLTLSDLALLKSSPLKEYELYVDQEVLPHSDIIYKMFLCLLDRK